MGQLQIVEPVETINRITNPSVEINLTNWAATGGSTIFRSLERARFGRASVQANTVGFFQAEGTFYSHATALSDSPITVSAYVRGDKGSEVRLRVVDTGNALEARSATVVLQDQFWQRVSVTTQIGPAPAGTIEIYFETPDEAQIITFYVDALQLERTGFLTTYVDGDLELAIPRHKGEPYFEWEGAKHTSASMRSDQYRLGGRLIDLSQGLDPELWYTNASGLGMPPLRALMTTFVDQDVAEYQRSIPLPRVLQITFWATKLLIEKVKREGTANLEPLHVAREALERIVKPDLVMESQTSLLRYLNGSAPMDLQAIYETGLEWDGDLRFPYNDNFAARFLCPDPLWRADTQDVCNLEANQDSVSQGLFARIDGEWQMHDTDGENVNVIAVHPQSGEIYVGGAFEEMDGNFDCIRVCIFSPDGSTVRGLDLGGGPGIDDGEVLAFSFQADGTVIVGGSFTDIDGAAFNNIAQYDPVADTFSTMGVDPGLDDAVRGLASALNGDVYVGGDFLDTFAATTTLNRFGIWEPGTDSFVAVGGGPGLDGPVHDVIIDFDGAVAFLAGAFTAEFGGAPLSLKRVAEFDGFSTYTQMGLDGSEDTVLKLSRARNGDIYAAGLFTNIGFGDKEKVALFNRVDWLPLGQVGAGVTGGDALWVDTAPDGQVLFSGDFDGATGVKAGFINQLAFWNGTVFGSADIIPPDSPEVRTVAFNGKDIWAGGTWDDNEDTVFASIQTCTNTGKARGGAVLEVFGPADLFTLENQTTAQLVQMQFEIKDGETLRLDLRRGLQSAISDWRGNIIQDLLPDSDQFDLLPGDNRIAFFALFPDQSEFSLRWQVSNWSFDD